MAAHAQTDLAGLIAQGQFEQALRVSESALETNDHPDLHLMRAYALLGLGAASAAQDAARSAAGTTQKFHLNILRGHASRAKEDHNIAGYWYRLAYDASETDAQRKAVQHFSNQSRAARSWSWDAQFTMRNSDNLNLATRDTEVELGGLPFKLSEDSVAKAGTQVSAYFTGKYKVVNTSNALFEVGATTTATFQTEEGRTGRGLSILFDGRRNVQSKVDGLVFKYGASLNKNFEDEDTTSTGQKMHLGLSGVLQPRVNWTLGLSANRTQSDAPDQTDVKLSFGLNSVTQTGWGFGLNASRSKLITDNAASASGTRALTAYLSSPCQGCSIGYQVFASLSQTDYTEVTPFFGGYRSDVLKTIGLTMTPKKISVAGFNPTVTFKLVERESNIDVNDAKSSDMFVGLRSAF